MAKRVNAEEQRHRIVRSAFRVLARDGLTGLSMRQVAKEAGCTIGLINHWFTSKEDLVMAAWREAVRRENERAEQLRAEGRFQADQLLLDTLPTTPELRRKELVWQSFAALAVSDPAIRKIHIRHYDYARGMLSEALARNRSPDDQDEEIADLLIAATDGIAKMAALDPARWPAARQREALRKLIEPHLGAPRLATGTQKRRVKSAP
ncbi:MAG: TetR/AcrR family transcriptional regulator [Steroidobacteraceae bacterium]|nr:TetR/AcrR family transcriptional regulator [Steroidobacteraceae bacterium]